MFSRAGFIAGEPAQPQGRDGETKPAATSLFEWVLDNEREREEEPAGAGRQAQGKGEDTTRSGVLPRSSRYAGFLVVLNYHAPERRSRLSRRRCRPVLRPRWPCFPSWRSGVRNADVPSDLTAGASGAEGSAVLPGQA